MARTAESMDNVAVRLLTGVVTALLVGALMLTGCSRSLEGIAAMGPRGVDPAYFFAGDVPTYGQRLNPDEVTTLAYLRAMRRIDPCGLLTRDALAKIGEIGSVGTLFVLDECDVDIKVPGEANRRYASIEVILNRMAGQPVAFLAGGLPVRDAVAVYPSALAERDPCQVLADTRQRRERDGVELLVDARWSSGPRWWWTAAASIATS
jgi:hypothetical protein